MGKKYNIIYADPPWKYRDKCQDRGGAERHYNTMPVEDIKKINVQSISDDDCTLFLWATFPKLQEALDVIEAWGFSYKTCAFVWVKTNKRMNKEQNSFLPVDSFDSFTGMGRWTRSNAEICLLATKGKPERKDMGVHQIIYAPIARHSEKPKETRDRIVRLIGNLPRIELFCRRKAEGWDIWGNELENDIDL